jgi:hypothetical protein
MTMNQVVTLLASATLFAIMLALMAACTTPPQTLREAGNSGSSREKEIFPCAGASRWPPGSPWVPPGTVEQEKDQGCSPDGPSLARAGEADDARALRCGGGLNRSPAFLPRSQLRVIEPLSTTGSA